MTGPARRPGGGRKKLVGRDASLLNDLLRAGNLGRPGAALEMGLEEPRQACDSAAGNGAQSVAADRLRFHPRAIVHRPKQPPLLKEAVEARKQRAGHACGGDYTLSLLQ